MPLKKTSGEHLQLLTDMGDLASIEAGGADIPHFLKKCARRLATHLDASVCSIYLFDAATAELTLKASSGTDAAPAGAGTVKLGQGPVGRCMKELRLIASASGAEPHGPAFVAMPVHRGMARTGVLALARQTGAPFTETELLVVKAMAAQLAGAIENARVLLEIRGEAAGRATAHHEMPPPLIKGKVASPGYAHAPAALFRRRAAFDTLDALDYGRGGTAADLRRALRRTKDELLQLQGKLAQRLPEVAALIFDAHLMILEDENFAGRMFQVLAAGQTARAALLAVAREYASFFQSSRHEYIREKSHDVEDLTLRIMANLNRSRKDVAPAFERRIVIAALLYPSDVLKLAVEGVVGIVMASGGATSHVAILARSFGIPLIIAACPELMSLPNGVVVLMDATVGNIFVSPSAEVTQRYAGHERARAAVAAMGASMRDETLTCDGVRITLMANINLLSDLDTATKLKAEGIGLYRSEFPFLVRQTFPSEEEQRVVYRHLLDRMPGREVTIRTLDTGGDKIMAFMESGGEANPELGLRATRFTLKNPEVFDEQIRAILSAGDAAGRARLMFPMVSSLDEFRAAHKRVVDAIAYIEATRGSAIPMPKVGMMVEVPAAMETIEDFIGEADFFSIGTNDLVQYMLAADRANERVAEYYCPHHPAVLRSLKRVVGQLLSAGCDVSVCGEMAHDMRYVPFLVGIGLRKFSIDPHHIPAVQKLIGGFSLDWAREYAEALARQKSVAEVAARLRDGGELQARC